MSPPDGWIEVKGDGSDPLPQLGRWYEARLRSGSIWHELCTTPICAKLGRPFVHAPAGASMLRRCDVLAIRFYDSGHYFRELGQ